MLANIAMRAANEAPEAVARSSGLMYTWYADDMVFSSTDPDFTLELASEVIRRMYRILATYGLSPKVANTHCGLSARSQSGLGRSFSACEIDFPLHNCALSRRTTHGY